MGKNIFFCLCVGMYGIKAVAQQHNFAELMQCHNSSKAPGMVVRLEQSGKHIYSGAVGLANIDTERPLNVDDIFQIGSVTKTFTAAAILKLSEEKKLSLQDTLAKFIPDINPEFRYLTIDRILSHTSGLPDYLGDPSVSKIYDKYASIDQVIQSISKQPLNSESGKKYSYSNLGYVFLGKVIEIASGTPYDLFMSNTFFKPLKMDNTFVITKGTSAGEINGYTTSRNEPKKYINPEDSTERRWNVDRSWIYSAGAIASTLADMHLWQNALKSGHIISKESYKLMTSKALLNNNAHVNYGYGLDIYKISGLDSFSHQGQVPGFFAWHVYFPNEDLTATALTNIDTKHLGPALLDMIALQLNLSPKPVNSQKEKAIAASLVGSYRSSDSKILKISFEKGTLYSQYEGENKIKIIPRENNSYSYECTENYFQLRENNGKHEIVPVYLYQGEQEALVKLEL
ncbi:serine hydrolase [Pseudoalteromonas sp. SG44-17]|uniref:serine hydrolase domain-containing protein n=1 Tax=Pseudoalteromonas sp. SG44-17 TaxID=2760963 RepID=UPI0016022345|nr:serine hydrolase domain-containing protein [Pseudoalteromonas sp. SG44-17]MBB1411439.1 beta-lactamase family protein [Pseudoalteromonas sp. SG44-17]